MKDYALRVYGCEAVARACLAAQDDCGMDVNLLLYGAWLADRRVTLTAQRVAEAVTVCEEHRRERVLPLRARRRDLSAIADAVVDYEAAKAEELEAEFQQLQMLQAIPVDDAGGPQGAPPREKMAGNLAELCAYYGQSADTLDSLARALEGLSTDR